MNPGIPNRGGVFMDFSRLLRTVIRILVTVGLCGVVVQAFAEETPQQQRRREARERVASAAEERMKTDPTYAAYIEAVGKRMEAVSKMRSTGPTVVVLPGKNAAAKAPAKTEAAKPPATEKEKENK
jgi:hypothetical protein